MENYRILVVDDDLSILDLYKDILVDDGYNVRTASGGEEALAFLEPFDPHIILLDVHMPSMNGKEACRRIRQKPGYERGGNKRIIMFSDKAQSEQDAAEGLNLGADVYEPRRPTSSFLILALVKSAVHTLEEESEYVWIDERFGIANFKPEIICDKETIRIAPTKHRLLKYLFDNLNQCCERTDITDQVGIADTTLYRYISELREVIEANREAPQYIITYPGSVMLQKQDAYV